MIKIEPEKLKKIIEAILMAANKPMTLDQIIKTFPELESPSIADAQDAILSLQEDCAERAIELKQVASGYRYQIRQDYAQWVGRLWEEKPPKYSRALLETLALIAYRQPITRGEIEEIRGVAVATNIIKTMQERNWVRIVGHRDVPGRPALYATTKQFLDYFNLDSLEQLPTLIDMSNFEKTHPELTLATQDDAAETVVEAEDENQTIAANDETLEPTAEVETTAEDTTETISRVE